MGASIALIIWLGRGVTYSIDELFWFEDSPDLGIGGAMQPHIGHLVFTSRILYSFVFETLGTGYLPFRLLALGAVLLTVTLLFTYLSRRIGPVAALAPSLVLLFFGSDPNHLLQGNGFTVLFSISCGLGALLSLERNDGRGDFAACGLLCLGIATYSVALAYVFAAAISVLLRADRWRRVWIVLVPVVIYTGWWLWARDSPGSSEQQIVLSDLLLTPAWGFRSLSAVLGALTGLDYNFAGSSGETATAGATLAVAGLAAFAWRLKLGGIPSALWVALGLLVSLWTLQAVAPNAERLPWSPRYLYPVAVAVLLVGAEAMRGRNWSRTALVSLYLVAAFGLATNLKLLHSSAAELREVYSPQFQGELTGIEMAAGRADPNYIPSSPAARATRLDAVFAAFAERGKPPTETYLAAARKYGGLGYSPREFLQLSGTERALAKSAFVAASRSPQQTP